MHINMSSLCPGWDTSLVFLFDLFNQVKKKKKKMLKLKNLFYKSDLAKRQRTLNTIQLHKQKLIQLYIYIKHLHPPQLLTKSFKNEVLSVLKWCERPTLEHTAHSEDDSNLEGQRTNRKEFFFPIQLSLWRLKGETGPGTEGCSWWLLCE